jgi:hypothetical protein
MSRRWWWVLVVVAAFGGAVPAYAQPRPGVRAGVSGSPGQFVFGGHVETAPLIEHVTFRPNIEIGVGDNVTLIAINFEFAYWIPIQKQPWSVYLGGGPAAVIQSFRGERAGHGDSGVGGGFNVLVGLQHKEGLFTEVKVGAMDSPSVKFTVGYVFK